MVVEVEVGTHHFHLVSLVFDFLGLHKVEISRLNPAEKVSAPCVKTPYYNTNDLNSNNRRYFLPPVSFAFFALLLKSSYSSELKRESWHWNGNNPPILLPLVTGSATNNKFVCSPHIPVIDRFHTMALPSTVVMDRWCNLTIILISPLIRWWLWGVVAPGDVSPDAANILGVGLTAGQRRWT